MTSLFAIYHLMVFPDLEACLSCQMCRPEHPAGIFKRDNCSVSGIVAPFFFKHSIDNPAKMSSQGT